MTSLMIRNEIHTATGKTKVAQFGWKKLDQPGELVWLDKSILRVDRAYQRPENLNKALAIAQSFNWSSFGVISVAKRVSDQGFYVFDGQHRVLAAMKRVDVDQLPCIVFETRVATEEASAFLKANTLRRMPTSIEKWRPQLMSGDAATICVDALVKAAGRSVANHSSPSTVSCLTSLLIAASTDRAALERVWPIITEVCEGKSLHNRLVDGLLYIEKNLPDGQSLRDKMWRDRLIRCGHERLLEGLQRSASFYGKTGARIYALGILETVNKGCRIDMVLRSSA